MTKTKGEPDKRGNRQYNSKGKGGVIGKDSSVGNEAVDCGKRKRDESGSGAGGMVAKKRCVNQ